MIEADCYMCTKSIDGFAALLLTPPRNNTKKKHSRIVIDKIHLCGKCYHNVLAFIESYNITTKRVE